MTVGALAATSLTLWGAPAKREVFTVTQPDGSTLQVRQVGDEYRHFLLTEDGIVLAEPVDGAYCYATIGTDGILKSTGIKAVDLQSRTHLPAEALNISDVRLAELAKPKRLAQSGMGRFETSFPSKGNPKALVVLVEYQNVKFSIKDPHAYFNALLTEEGFSQYGSTGSAKDYFRDNSMGQFVPEFDVYGPIKLANRRSYYGANDNIGNDKRPGEMVVEAIKALDDEVDFSVYDTDGDGYVDNVYVFYAGEGEATASQPDAVWPHSGDLSASNLMFTVDGVKVNHYACSNEWENEEPVGIGTFVHEFSHVMGLPDLYHTSYGTRDYTPNKYNVMDYGIYNNGGRTPTGYSIYERNAMGWMELEVLTDAVNARLDNMQESNRGYIIPTGSDNEFFLLENRQQTGWDTYIPGHGMLIWHIDYDRADFNNNRVNNDPYHQRVDIEEAAGITTLMSTEVMASYTFPGTYGITSFTDDTQPSMKTWAGENLGMPITNIVENDGVITFAVAGGGMDIPVPAKAEEVEKSENHFVAAWAPVSGAVDYEVTVYTADSSYETLTPYKDYSTGGNTSLRVDNIKEGCADYYFMVRAVGAERKSAYSQSVLVKLPVEAGIAGTVNTNDCAPEYFDILGRRVNHPVSGSILIERRGANVRKVLIP